MPQQPSINEPPSIMELFAAIGELYVSRGRIGLKLQEMMTQADEMSKTISDLRQENMMLKMELENGRLVKSDSDH